MRRFRAKLRIRYLNCDGRGKELGASLQRQKNTFVCAFWSGAWRTWLYTHTLTHTDVPSNRVTEQQKPGSDMQMNSHIFSHVCLFLSVHLWQWMWLDHLAGCRLYEFQAPLGCRGPQAGLTGEGGGAAPLSHSWTSTDSNVTPRHEHIDMQHKSANKLHTDSFFTCTRAAGSHVTHQTFITGFDSPATASKQCSKPSLLQMFVSL